MDKDGLLALLDQRNRDWEALLGEVGESRMDHQGVNGDWSFKDIVAHLTGWNRWLVARLLAAHQGEPPPPPPWPAHLEAEDAINGWIYAASRGRSVRDVLDEARAVYQQLRASIAGLPDDIRIERVEPAYFLVWIGATRFPVGEFFDHFHEDHEPDVRAWLAREADQAVSQSMIQ